MSHHTELIDKVNSAKTVYEHTYAKGFLDGWRQTVEWWDFVEADEHTESLYPGRPYCCGVLLDWKPTS